MNKTMERKQIAWTICCIAVLLGAAYGILQHFGATDEVIACLENISLWIIPLMLLSTYCMWHAAGRMWTLFLDDKFTPYMASCTQYAINFVDVVLPYINKSGFNFAQERLIGLGFMRDDAENMITLRYMISILTKWIEIAIAMGVILTVDWAQKMPTWESWLTCVMAAGVILGITIGFILLHKRVTVPMDVQTDLKYGKRARDLQRMLDRLYMLASDLMNRPGALLYSLFWGMIYSLFEVMPFCIVALMIGYPEMILGVIATSGLAIIVGIVTPTPMGLIGFDLVMIGLLCAMGFGVAPVIVIVVGARLMVFAITAITGIPFWRIAE